MQTTIAIVEAYAKLKEVSRMIVEIPQQENDTSVQKKLLHRGGQLMEGLITDVLPKKSPRPPSNWISPRSNFDIR